jgi:TetR/AcrR family transcriptional regulator
MELAALLARAENAAVRPAGRLRQARVAKILEAAEYEFAAKGFEGTTTADIAARAGLPKANVHYYFGTKDKIYCAVLENILLLWVDEADHWIAPGRSAREGLGGYIAAKILLAREKPLGSRIYAGELLRGAPHIAGYLHFSLAAHVERLAVVIDGWIAAGEIKPVSATHLLFCIWAMTQTYADFDVQVSAVLGKLVNDDDVFETATKTVTALVLGSLLIEAGTKK